MRKATAFLATVLLLPLASCAAEIRNEQIETSKPPSASHELPVSPEAGESENSGVREVEFAFGFGRVSVPNDADVIVEDRDTLGEAPRFGGGLITLHLADATIVWVNLNSPAGVSTMQSGPPCGDSALLDFPGSPMIPAENRVHAVTASLGPGLERLVILLLATAPPVGEKCAPLAVIDLPDGGVVTAVAEHRLPADSTEADATTWVQSEDGQRLVELLRSVKVE